MLKLNDTTGKLTIKALGIKLTQDSTQEQLQDAIKHRPELLGTFITETKKAESNEQRKPNKEVAN